MEFQKWAEDLRSLWISFIVFFFKIIFGRRGHFNGHFPLPHRQQVSIQCQCHLYLFPQIIHILIVNGKLKALLYLFSDLKEIASYVMKR